MANLTKITYKQIEGATLGSVLVSGAAGAEWGSLPTKVVREIPTLTGPLQYTLAAIPASGSEEVYVNGVLQNQGASYDYQISGAVITFAAPLPVDPIILVSYTNSDSTLPGVGGADPTKVLKTGDTMTGPLVVEATVQAAYVNTVGADSGISVYDDANNEVGYLGESGGNGRFGIYGPTGTVAFSLDGYSTIFTDYELIIGGGAGGIAPVAKLDVDGNINTRGVFMVDGVTFTGGLPVDYRQNFVATAGQTVFTLTGGETYVPGNKNLKVYDGGILMTPGASADYQEDGVGEAITFNSGRDLDSNVSLIWAK